VNAGTARARTLVALVDESVLCADSGERLDFNALELLLDDVAKLWSEGLRCTLVITGEATIGRIRCGKLSGVPRERRNDVWGAVGRATLDSWITSRLGDRGLRTGSLHLTRASFASREAYGAVRDCLRGLEANESIPIVWDNGWMSKESAEHNSDQLMAMIASQAGAEMAVIGLSGPAMLKRGSEPWGTGRIQLDDLVAGINEGKIHVLRPIRPRLESILAAARLLGTMGIPLMIVGLKPPNTLAKALRGDVESLILEGKEATVPGRAGVKRWLSAGAIPRGGIIVSPYAATQLSEEIDRSSLLAAGVVDTVGCFRENDVVAVEDESRTLLGYGVAKFGSREVAELRGQRNVIVVHADQFYGVGLRELVRTDETGLDDPIAERT
jgi:glutamate 5-kinase